MKKIGFIDYYLNEWHADNYPELIFNASEGKYKVCYAYGHIDPPSESGLMSNADWAKAHNIELLDSIEEVVEKSDCLIVLSPDNPEMHPLLCELPLKSGKPTYIDKTFAIDKETAITIFEHADLYDTKCFSTSALRFAEELENIDTDAIDRIYCEGPSSLSVYGIHQIEMIVCLMKKRVTRVMSLGEETHPSIVIEFEDGRYAQFYHRDDANWSFRITTVDKKNRAENYVIQSDFFGRFIKAMIRFFETVESPVSHEQTIDIIAVRAAAIKACAAPFQWLTL